jgi:hypothetical protein
MDRLDDEAMKREIAHAKKIQEQRKGWDGRRPKTLRDIFNEHGQLLDEEKPQSDMS